MVMVVLDQSEVTVDLEEIVDLEQRVDLLVSLEALHPDQDTVDLQDLVVTVHPLDLGDKDHLDLEVKADPQDTEEVDYPVTVVLPELRAALLHSDRVVHQDLEVRADSERVDHQGLADKVDLLHSEDRVDILAGLRDSAAVPSHHLLDKTHILLMVLTSLQGKKSQSLSP